MKGYVRIKSILIALAVIVFVVISVALIVAYRRPPFYTSANWLSTKTDIYPYWRAEKNYIDQYGNLWVFDVYVNQIVVLQPGMSYFVDHGYIGTEDVFTDDSGSVSYLVYFRFNEGHKMFWGTSDLGALYRERGHWVNFEYDRSSATFFSCCPLKTRIPLKENTFMIGIGKKLDTYELSDGAAKRILYGNKLFYEDAAIDALIKSVVAEDKEELAGRIKNAHQE